jgi:hypothetical protein
MWPHLRLKFSLHFCSTIPACCSSEIKVCISHYRWERWVCEVGRSDSDVLKLYAVWRSEKGWSEHPDTLRSMEGWQRPYNRLEQRKEAVNVNKDCPEITKVLGPEHPNMLRRMNVASTLRNLIM